MPAKEIPIGCGEWGFREIPMRQHFEIAQQFGFHWLEFGIGGQLAGRLHRQSTDQEIEGFLDLLDEFDVMCPCCALENDFTLPDAAAHDEMVSRTLDQFNVAAMCRATHLRLHAGQTPAAEMTEESWARMIEAFHLCQAEASRRGLTLAIETISIASKNADGTNSPVAAVTSDRECLKRLIAELPPEIGFNFDPGNLKPIHPDDPLCCLDILNGHINYCHLKDWARLGAGWVPVAMGEGGLDFGPIFQEMSYDGICLIEYEAPFDTVDGIQRSLTYLANLQDDYPDLQFVI